MVDRSAWEVSMTAPGMLIAGRYRLVERIAAGGMGWVWEAWDELLHRKVAVKQLLRQPGLAAEDAELARRRLIREARITARLHHPHVVSLYDVVEHDGGPCLIMQYVPSRSLNALLQDRGVLREAAVLRIGAEVAAGLAAAHEVGIVHRDVKPANVLITEDGAAKLTDFGISHAVGDANLTATGMVTGTPAYLAPEVARGGVVRRSPPTCSPSARRCTRRWRGRRRSAPTRTRWRSCTGWRRARSPRRSAVAA